MKRAAILLVLIMFLSTASADIILNEQPDKVYNLGDAVEIPVTIIATNNIEGELKMELICNGPAITFYTNGVKLSAGEEKTFDPSAILTKSKIGTIKGQCKIKASLEGENFVMTDEFKISDAIKVSVDMEGKEYYPGDIILIEGTAAKENDKDVNGFIEVELSSIKTTVKVQGTETETTEETDTETSDETDTETDEETETSETETNEETSTDTTTILADAVDNGFFSIETELAKDLPAGTHPIKIKVYEKDANGVITNQGFADSSIKILQKPTSLEVIPENKEVEPGTNLILKTILHDQTGEPIESNVMITIKDSDGIVIDKIEKSTLENYELPIAYNEPPKTWEITAESGEFITEQNFNIKEKAEVQTVIINKTLIVTNTGNVPYNDSYLVKIGDESMSIKLELDIDETKKYILSAPDGEYNIELIGPEGETQLTENVALTGNSINIKEASGRIGTIIRYPIVWIFMITIMGFVAFMVAKKGYRKSFIGYISKMKKSENKTTPRKKDSLIESPNKAELSLSLKGDKQSTSIVCFKLKNFKELLANKKGIQETLNKINNIIEENKAAIYENQESIFILLAPIKTRTFGNEKIAIKIAKSISEILKEHNKLFRQKIEFGIGLENGAIIAKQEGSVMKFMSMGTLITSSKKIAAISKEDILLGEKIKDKLASSVKTQKEKDGNLEYYKVKEIKNTEEHKRFLRNFLDRLEGKN